MSLTYGFYNSINHDRTYSAEDMSEIFNGIINDGIFQNIGNHMAVSPGSDGLSVNIGTGRAWFDGTWSLNDSIYVLTFEDAPYVANYSRIDAVCLKVDKTNSVRANSFVVVKGTETSQDPSKPSLPSTDVTFYHPLAYVTIKNGDTAIAASAIENNIGIEPTPFVTGILETVEISELLTQWQAQWDEWLANKKSTSDTEWSDFMDKAESTWNTWYSGTTDSETTLFSNWFTNIQNQLSEDAAGKLQSEIDAITNIYVDGNTLYLPNTTASVTDDGILVLGN